MPLWYFGRPARPCPSGSQRRVWQQKLVLLRLLCNLKAAFEFFPIAIPAWLYVCNKFQPFLLLDYRLWWSGSYLCDSVTDILLPYDHLSSYDVWGGFWIKRNYFVWSIVMMFQFSSLSPFGSSFFVRLDRLPEKSTTERPWSQWVALLLEDFV